MSLASLESLEAKVLVTGRVLVALVWARQDLSSGVSTVSMAPCVWERLDPGVQHRGDDEGELIKVSNGKAASVRDQHPPTLRWR